MDADIFDDEFQGCAFWAFLEQAAIEQAMPPDSEATRRRAYALYEQALAEKNARRSAA
jgi:hypothetical protein